VAVRGDRSTVCVGGSTLPNDTLVTHGPSMRVVFDLADSSGWFIVPPGNSGDPSSPHYADLLDDWAQVRYRKLDLAWPTDQEIESRGRLGPKP
jgi:penicillin amidase